MAAIKFYDQHCPTVITGPVVIEQIANPPADFGMLTVAVCLRRVDVIPAHVYGWIAAGW
jgi:hypothetical protein